MVGTAHSPLVSIMILNYNGERWMRRCLESLQAQTLFAQIQVIVADNASTDGSDRLSEKLLAGWSNALFIQNGTNVGFAAGSNLAVKQATGKYLFFLNPDVWLEPDCVEQLYRATESAQAGAAGLLMLDYDSDNLQTRGGVAFDFCGYAVIPKRGRVPEILFAACGFYFIRAELFRRLGGFEDQYFLYGEETDLSWRVWICGEKIIHAPAARVHHRGEASINPRGGTRIVEFRTSDMKRFYANRNHLITLLKNAEHLLLLMVVPYVALQFAESLVGMIVLRRWSFFRTSFLAAVAGCWKLREHMKAERQRIRSFRKRSDFWMLRFLTWRFGRWPEVRKIFTMGLPVVDSRERQRSSRPAQGHK
jgi:GT2 family glycosyltransferase